MKLLLFALLPCVLALPPLVVDMNQEKHLQTDIDMGRDMEHLFSTFKQVHSRVYADQWEEQYRRGIFEAHVSHIKDHNKKYSNGEKSYFLGVNQFTDMTHKEFLQLYTGHIKDRQQHNASTYLSPSNILLPDQVDWRQKGYVTPVKNQGQCGSCWSFSATGSIEGQHFKATGKLISLSEQQLVDCSGSFGNQGCNGGLMDQAFEYVKSSGGLESEDDYPYLAEERDCTFDEYKVEATVTGYVDIPEGSESQLQAAVAAIGPVSIAIDASHSSFQFYSGGIYDEPECSSTQLDHGVLVVGYGNDAQEYWLVKNSWGTSWGDEGYVKMIRNKENQCGVATQASYPLV
ncbi:procathepsin L-like isoform X2 [Mya arenaria]|uniref:procathepsin L-like isoform X2 n=1 Tax=Mya arenaria TaxID=6604 RepID=UPI0022E32E5A|nr:procathepsin L-like isoform X2 [Mya arenaria]